MSQLLDKYTMCTPCLESRNLLDVLLENRGIQGDDDKSNFLQPQWNDNHDPMLLHNMDHAVSRIWQAVENNEKILVFSDYDADGVPGAVIASDFFEKIGYTNFSIHIPNRNTDGFGLNMSACQQFIDDSVQLLITIDCGISDRDEIAFLCTHDVDVIVTDHHLPSSDGLPDAIVIDPKQPDCQYPFPDLCGSGVIFKLVQSLLNNQPAGYDINPEWSKWLLDMVAIATICDMVPLTGENRIFAHYGLQVLHKSPRSGLQTMLRLARINQSIMTAQDVAFGIGPRINAASRLGDPMTAFRALSQTGIDGIAAAGELEKLNRKRKTMVATAVKSAYKTVDAQDPSDVIVLGNADWPLGIVGLVAGKVAEKYGKPTFVWTRVDDMYKGSARSGNGHSVHQIMALSGSDTFVSYGGHADAGGFVCDQDHIHTLSQTLNAVDLDASLADTDKTPIDAPITADQVTIAHWNSICQLEPFGFANRSPLFVLQRVQVSSVRLFGSEKNHISLGFQNTHGASIHAICFNHTELLDANPQTGDILDVVVSFEMNSYNGRDELRLRIQDIFV